jgi:DNA topoisomerase-2
MDDSMMDDSVFSDGGSENFEPPAKPAKVTKAKAPPKKAAALAKPRGRPAGATAKPKAKAPPKKKKVVSDEENSDIDMAEDPLEDDESLLQDTPPKQKKAPAPKKTSGKPLADIDNESFDAAAVKKASSGASSKYQMVSAAP